MFDLDHEVLGDVSERVGPSCEAAAAQTGSMSGIHATRFYSVTTQKTLNNLIIKELIENGLIIF